MVPEAIYNWYSVLGVANNNIEVLISNCPALVVRWKSLLAGATCFTSAKRVRGESIYRENQWRFTALQQHPLSRW